MTTPYTAYLVRTSWADGTHVMVRRRYTDFVMLYDSIVRRYKGMVPPSVPPKKTFFNSSASHIMQRMRALGIFTERIACNPYLRCDAVVDSFLQDTEMAWDMVKEKIETAVKAKGAFFSSSASNQVLMLVLT